jgi:hypothetical protein
LTLWREATTGQRHIHRADTDNISITLKHGTSVAYTLDRLKRERPDLFDKVRRQPKAKRDQAMAEFFYRSGWTQEELAKKEGKSRQWIEKRLRFGRFLSFATSVANSELAPNNLTEGRFRSYWERTEGSNERQRLFGAVLKLLQEQTVVKQAGDNTSRILQLSAKELLCRELWWRA